MADNELTVIAADGSTKTLRSVDLGSGVQAQTASLLEHGEIPVSPTGGLEKYSVGAGAAVSLDSPTAAARYCRLRVWHATQSSTKRLFYRQDNGTLSADGSDAVGYLMHGDVFLVKLGTMTNFKMRAETGETFEVFGEWLNPA